MASSVPGAGVASAPLLARCFLLGASADMRDSEQARAFAAGDFSFRGARVAGPGGSSLALRVVVEKHALCRARAHRRSTALGRAPMRALTPLAALVAAAAALRGGLGAAVPRWRLLG